MSRWRDGDGENVHFFLLPCFLLPCSFFLLKCLLPLALAKNLPDQGKIASRSPLRCPCFLHAIGPCGQRCNERVGSNLCCRKCRYANRRLLLLLLSCCVISYIEMTPDAC